MIWNVEYFHSAQKDLEKLDHSQQLLILKAIEKVRLNPLPISEGGYGKPLENRNGTKLAGLLKIKLKNAGLRIVYQIIRKHNTMQIIVISIRQNETVYKLAEQRLSNNQTSKI